MVAGRIQVERLAGSSRYELVLHETSDLVVGGWSVRLIGSDGQARWTDFLPSAASPEAVFRWIAPHVGPDIALALVRQAQVALDEREARGPMAV